MNKRTRCPLWIGLLALLLAALACGPLAAGTPPPEAVEPLVSLPTEVETQGEEPPQPTLAFADRPTPDDQAGGGGQSGGTTGGSGGGSLPPGLITPAPDGSTMPPSGMGLLTTPPLSMGIQGWDLWLQGGSRVEGQNTVRLVQDPMFMQVVEMQRADGGNDGGAAGIVLPLSLDVSGFPHVYVWLVGKVIAAEGGNIASTNPAWYPEGAVQVRVSYIPVGGQTEQEWFHGFYTEPLSGANAANFSLVPAGEWFRYAADLALLPARPATITGIRVYGFGWEFTGQVAEVNIIASPDP